MAGGWKPKKRGFEIRACGEPWARLVQFKKGGVNLQATLKGMAPGQAISVRMLAMGDISRIRGAANNAKIRVKISPHPALNTVTVTSRGPQRSIKDRRTSSRVKPRGPRFQGWKEPATPAPKSKAAENGLPDIFS